MEGFMGGFFLCDGFFYLMLFTSLGVLMVNRDVGFFEGVKWVGCVGGCA